MFFKACNAPHDRIGRPFYSLCDLLDRARPIFHEGLEVGIKIFGPYEAVKNLPAYIAKRASMRAFGLAVPVVGVRSATRDIQHIIIVKAGFTQGPDRA
jgi:hypothetical protein